MQRNSVWRALGVASLAGAALVLTACGDGDDTRQVAGEFGDVFGSQASTWARLDGDDNVVQAGATLPSGAINNAEDAVVRHDGDGPAGAQVALSFPQEVRDSTFLNHAEFHWNPEGHPGPAFMTPHWDFHFYADDEADVLAIDCSDTTLPEADRVPEGYHIDTLPNNDPICVPEMGIHAADPDTFPSEGVFSHTFIMGYYGGNLTFIEPMITRAFLQSHATYEVEVPRPEVVGRHTRYPRNFVARYNAETDAYDLVFSDFETVN